MVDPPHAHLTQLHRLLGRQLELVLLFPADDTYTVVVHGYETDGPDANYTLTSWDYGLVDDRGNMTVSAPDAATLGAVAGFVVMMVLDVALG